MGHYILTIRYASGRIKAVLILTAEEMYRVAPRPGGLRCTLRVATADDMRRVLGRKD